MGDQASEWFGVASQRYEVWSAFRRDGCLLDSRRVEDDFASEDRSLRGWRNVDKSGRVNALERSDVTRC